MSWLLEISNCAKKEMRKIPKKDFVHVGAVIDSMKTDPFIGDLQKLRGKKDEYRRRIGNWRIFFLVTTSEQKIIIKHVRRRDSKTYRR